MTERVLTITNPPDEPVKYYWNQVTKIHVVDKKNLHDNVNYMDIGDEIDLSDVWEYLIGLNLVDEFHGNLYSTDDSDVIDIPGVLSREKISEILSEETRDILTLLHRGMVTRCVPDHESRTFD